MTLSLILGLFIFKRERILLFPLFFSISQNFFQTIWKSFSVKLSEGKLSNFSSCIFSVEFLKLKLARDKDDTSSSWGELNNFLLAGSVLSSSSFVSLFIRLIISEVLIKDFFF